MKWILLLLLLFSYSNADEVSRIELIVKDINKLRNDYNKVEEELGIYKYDLRDEKEKNEILTKEINNLVIELKKAKKAIKVKDNRNKISKNTLNDIAKNKIILQKCMDNQIIEENNVFPDLQMKKEFLQNKKETLSTFKAKSFRFNKSAKVLDSINGELIDEWEITTSFTSNVKSKNWVKITGYFVDKVWRPAEKEMWVRATDVTVRAN